MQTGRKRMIDKKTLTFGILLYLAAGGTALAASVTVDGTLDASDITKSSTLNRIEISENGKAIVTHGDKTFEVVNRGSDEGWEKVLGGSSTGYDPDESHQPMGNTISVTGDQDITIRRLIGGEVTGVSQQDVRVVNNNIISISGSGTLKADEIIAGYRSSSPDAENTVHGNVIDIEGRTITSTAEGGRVAIYGGKVGKVPYYIDHGNAEYGIINISGDAKLENADVYGGYTNIGRWGGHVLNAQINISGDADLSTTRLYGADTGMYYHNERNNVLNIGYINHISTNPQGRFPINDGEDGKGTYLVEKSEVLPWNNNIVQEVGQFTAIKIWAMKDYKTPALQVTGNGNFMYSYSKKNNRYTVIDLSYLTSGKDYGNNYGQDGQDKNEWAVQNEERTATIDLTKNGVDPSTIFFSDVKPNQKITVIDTAGPGVQNGNQIYYNPIIYGYQLSSHQNLLTGMYRGNAEADQGNVVWKTGNVSVSRISFDDTLDAAHRDTSLMKLEGYGYEFDENTVLSLDNLNVKNEGNTLLSPKDTWTLIDAGAVKSGSEYLIGMEQLKNKEKEVSYDMSGGRVTVTGRGKTDLASVSDHSENFDNTNLIFHVENPDSLTYHSLDWASSDPLVTLDAHKSYDLSGTVMDWSHLSHENKSFLKAGMNERVLLDAKGLDAGMKEEKLKGNLQPVTKGTTLEGMGKALLKDGNLIYQVNMEAQGQTHHVLLGQTSGLSALVESNDLVLDTMHTIHHADDGGTFATVGGGENRYETGSHITTSMWRGEAGFAGKRSGKDGSETVYGLFYDYGDGSYRTYFEGRRNGKFNYKGVGLFGRKIEKDGFYEEASLRIGRISVDSRNTLRDEDGRIYSYKTDSMYNAVHAGFGRIWDRGKGNTLDTYFRFFHTHINGDSFDAGGRYDIGSLDSNVVRIGTRWEYKDDRFTWYTGIAYEYEFSGKAYGTADDAFIRSASVRGGSVRFEYGATVETGKWTLSLNGSDYAGRRRGFNGSFSASCRIW